MTRRQKTVEIGVIATERGHIAGLEIHETDDGIVIEIDWTSKEIAMTVVMNDELQVKSFVYHEERFCGDTDGNGKVDLYDVVRVFYVVNGMMTLSDEGASAADVNGDGVVNLYDAARLFYYVNGIVGTL